MKVASHQEWYPSRQEIADDEWLAEVGSYGFFAITQDYNLHRRPFELAAIRRYEVGCFYLSGATSSKWETMRVFARGYDRIIDAALHTTRPFIYRVDRLGRLVRIAV